MQPGSSRLCGRVTGVREGQLKLEGGRWYLRRGKDYAGPEVFFPEGSYVTVELNRFGFIVGCWPSDWSPRVDVDGDRGVTPPGASRSRVAGAASARPRGAW